MSLRLEDFSDRELLYLVDDHGGEVTAQEIAEAINHRDPPVRNVSIRFSWLMRYGVMDNRIVKPDNEPPERRWKLTKAGEAYMTGRLDASKQRALENLDPNDLVLATNLVARRMVTASSEAAILMKREFSYHTAQRTKPWMRKRNNGR